MWLTMSYVLATLAVLLVVAGLAMARDRRRHVPLMIAAFIADVLGLLIVELTPLFRGEDDPVGNLIEHGHPMSITHATFATVSLVCYVLQIISGKKILAGDHARLVNHKKVAKIFIITRLAAYVTMFMLPEG